MSTYKQGILRIGVITKELVWDRETREDLEYSAVMLEKNENINFTGILEILVVGVKNVRLAKDQSKQ